jgi:hypothetical protein
MEKVHLLEGFINKIHQNAEEKYRVRDEKSNSEHKSWNRNALMNL